MYVRTQILLVLFSLDINRLDNLETKLKTLSRIGEDMMEHLSLIMSRKSWILRLVCSILKSRYTKYHILGNFR